MYTVEELKRDLENVPNDWIVRVLDDGSILYVVSPDNSCDEIDLAYM